MATELSSDVVETENLDRMFLVTMLKVYSDAAAIQFAEAEELMAVAIAAKQHASEMLDRCADLVAQYLPEESTVIPVLPVDTYEDIPF